MNEQLLTELVDFLDGLSYIPSDDIPEIDLYMDQLISFMDTRLQPILRHPEDKALTKTMINNYAKNRLLPPPDKKRYSREHLLLLILIFYYKGVLQLSDIETILRPLHEKYFSGEGELQLKDIYDEVFSMEPAEKQRLIDDVTEKFHRAEQSFPDFIKKSTANEVGSANALADASYEDVDEDPKTAETKDAKEEQEMLRLFAFLGELGFDVYLKKLLMEKIIDKIKEQYLLREKEEKESKLERKLHGKSRENSK